MKLRHNVTFNGFTVSEMEEFRKFLPRATPTLLSCTYKSRMLL